MTSPSSASPIIEAFISGSETLIILIGKLKLTHSEVIRRRIQKFFTDDCRTLYLVMNRLEEIDSSGLGVLVGLHMTSRKYKILFNLLQPTAYQMILLKTTRLTAILTIIGGVEGETIRQRLERPEFAVQSGPEVENP